MTLLAPPAVPEPAPPAATYYLALAYEELGRLAEARATYARYLERGTSGDLRRRVRSRLVLLERRELEEAVRAALQAEQQLAARAPATGTVGVFPFLSGLGEALRPLGQAFAELLSADLNQTGRLTVLERARIQFLLDELALAAGGTVDPQTAARAGRILGVSRVVQGRLDGSESALRVQALVVPVPAAQGFDTSPLDQQGSLGTLFDMQARIALDIYERLGVQLTVAERERVLQRPTANVQALLAFGFGLENEDAARYRAAIDNYRRAVALDPAFAEAQAALERAEAKAEAAEDQVEELVLAGELEFGPAVWLARRRRFAGVDRMVPEPDARDPLSEILGVEGLRRRALLDLIIRRPGGSQ